MTQPELGVEIEAPSTVPAVVPDEPVGVERLMALAIEKDGAIDIIERLASLREAEMDRDAERQFMEAFAAFRERCPAIPRNKRGAKFVDKAGTASYVMYAPLDTIQSVVDPILHSVGLSYWWSSTASETSVVTTCHLRHVGGHERTSAMALPVSGPPKSSKTQAHAGTRTFNKRITLSDVLGIQTTDDLDGEDTAGGGALTTEQVATLQEWVDSVDVDLPKFLAYYGAPDLEHIPAARYNHALSALKRRAK